MKFECDMLSKIRIDICQHLMIIQLMGITKCFDSYNACSVCCDIVQRSKMHFANLWSCFSFIIQVLHMLLEWGHLQKTSLHSRCLKISRCTRCLNERYTLGGQEACIHNFFVDSCSQFPRSLRGTFQL